VGPIIEIQFKSIDFCGRMPKSDKVMRKRGRASNYDHDSVTSDVTFN
jgi:hypothetical protein